MSKETQLRILWLVGVGVFFSVAAVLAIETWIGDRVWTMVLSLGIGALISLWISRRIAGPLYRIERDLESILGGTLQGKPIRLRYGDPLQHLAELLNELVERTRK